MQSFADANDFESGPNRVGEMLRDSGDQHFGIAHVQHHGTEGIAMGDLFLRLGKRHAAALAQAEQFLDGRA